MLVLTEAEQRFVFSNVSEAPVPSLLRLQRPRGAGA
jgi:aminopeptidase N